MTSSACIDARARTKEHLPDKLLCQSEQGVGQRPCWLSAFSTHRHTHTCVHGQHAPDHAMRVTGACVQLARMLDKSLAYQYACVHSYAKLTVFIGLCVSA